MDAEKARLIYRLSVAFALVCAVAVPVTYQWLSKGEWRKHPYGRHLMGSDSLLAFMLASYFIIALTPWNLWVDRLILSVEMLIFGIFRIYRVRFMMRSTQSTGYDSQAHTPERNPA